MIEKGRHLGIPREEPYCAYCKNIIEDEYHFVSKCPLYTALRNKYIPNKYHVMPTLHKFYSLMANANMEVIIKVAVYLFYAKKTRDTFMNLYHQYNTNGIEFTNS